MALTEERRLINGRSVRWSEEQAQLAYSQAYWVSDTLVEALAHTRQESPDRGLIVDNKQVLTASELDRQSTHLAGQLLQRYPTGSVVSFMLPNWFETAIIYLASTKAGMVANPILPSLRENELAFTLTDVESRAVFLAEQWRGHNCVDTLERAIAGLSIPPDLFLVRGTSNKHTPFSDLIRGSTANADLPALNADAVRMIMYTSGTTGRAKGIMHSHNSLHALIRQIGTHWRVEPNDSFLVASPISHIGGSIYAFECPLLLGSKAVLMERWNPKEAVDLLLEQRCTHMAGATPFLVQLLAAAREANTRLPDLKVFICGGASVPPSLITEAQNYFENAVVTRVYGSTEVPVTTVGVLGGDELEQAAHTDGALGIASVKIVNPQGQATAHGEILAHGAQMLRGYVHAEDEHQVFDAQGYYRTGDLGRLIDNKYLQIDGRLKDIIIRNGENIAPKEIEDILVKHSDIKEIAIVGLPDSKTGERACAVVVSDKKELKLNSLVNFLAEHSVAKFKYPEQLELWQELPKNAAGKVLKFQIQSALNETT